jgi:hypothetical protein
LTNVPSVNEHVSSMIKIPQETHKVLELARVC